MKESLNQKIEKLITMYSNVSDILNNKLILKIEEENFSEAHKISCQLNVYSLIISDLKESIK